MIRLVGEHARWAITELRGFWPRGAVGFELDDSGHMLRVTEVHEDGERIHHQRELPADHYLAQGKQEELPAGRNPGWVTVGEAIHALGFVSAELAHLSGAWDGKQPDWFPEPPEFLELFQSALPGGEYATRSTTEPPTGGHWIRITPAENGRLPRVHEQVAYGGGQGLADELAMVLQVGLPLPTPTPNPLQEPYDKLAADAAALAGGILAQHGGLRHSKSHTSYELTDIARRVRAATPEPPAR